MTTEQFFTSLTDICSKVHQSNLKQDIVLGVEYKAMFHGFEFSIYSNKKNKTLENSFIDSTKEPIYKSEKYYSWDQYEDIRQSILTDIQLKLLTL